MSRPVSAPEGRPRNAVNAVVTDEDLAIIDEARVRLDVSRSEVLRLAIRAFAREQKANGAE